MEYSTSNTFNYKTFSESIKYYTYSVLLYRQSPSKQHCSPETMKT